MRRAAELAVGGEDDRIRCRILDMSDGGACLAIYVPVTTLPRTFTLVVFKDASLQRNCEMVWTDGRYIGVKFISEWYGPRSNAALDARAKPH